jgi:pyruvate dehydrogenase E2 component (dihydrolipoamide acetyltransferase)
MEEGRVLQWLKKEGDAVESGDVVVEVETDKATMEVEAMGSGVLQKILVPANTTVPTGTVLGVVAAEDEDISDIIGQAGVTPAAARSDAGPEARPAAAAAVATAAAHVPPAGQDGGRVKASPLARRMADESGIALSMLQGSGPGGRVIKRDIEAAVAAGGAAPTAAPTEIFGTDVPHERVELSQIRKAIARNLVQSLGPIPHFFLTVEIDMGEVLGLRERLNSSLEDSGVKIGVNDILMKTAAQALAEHPDVNASFAGDHIRRFKRVDIGLAVAVPDGLITPVLRDVGAMGLKQISIESKELVARAREKKLAPEEYQGATFTISNLGMYGIDEFTAVINPPAATILAVGATVEKPVVVDGSIEVRSRMRITLSSDHRAVDGAMGAEFLATFKNMLENPLRLIL